MIQDIAPHIYDIMYKKVSPRETDTILLYKNIGILCHVEDGDIIFPTVADIAEKVPTIHTITTFLFCIDEVNYFTVLTEEISSFGTWDYLSIDGIRAVRPLHNTFAAITGYQIYKWYTDNRFCGGCGKPMVLAEAERALRCSSCGRLVFPKICPSVIVAVTKGNQILLTKYASAHSKYKKYALIAGYCEVGETLEDTVRREVKEEVGLDVKNIRYYKSQPWSFSDALLVGFFCEVDGEDAITLDENELSVAEWFDRDGLPMERSESSISLTGEMIDAFRDGYGK